MQMIIYVRLFFGNALTVRSDHSFSFWNDKNYDSLETYNQSLKDVGLIEAEQAARYVEISHFMLWNGIGVSYGHLWKLMRVNLATPLGAFFCPKASPYVKYCYVLGFKLRPNLLRSCLPLVG
jgi:hypothetical protein